jgi:carboxymethylenebutenolidase
VLKRLGKAYEFYRYTNAGHAFFNTARSAYRAEQAADGWTKVFAFLRKHLAA